MHQCRTDCIQRPLSLGFGGLGKLVGRYPWWFLLIPLVLSAGLGAGFYFLPQRKANDIEDQFTPIGGPAKTEREFVKLHFPTNDSGQFSAQRLYTEGLFVSLIAVSTSDNVINVNTFKELMQLDEMVQNLTMQLSGPGAVLSFQQLCAQDQDMKCIPPNPLLSAVKDNVSLIETIRITYPVLQGTIFLGQYLGGVTLDSDKIVQKAQAVKLVYYLREDNKEDQKDSVQWINLFIKSITENLDKLQLRSIQILRMHQCRTDCIQRPLSLGFGGLGKLVGRYPWWFLLIPLVLSAGLGAGFYFLPQKKANDIEDQFTPIGGPAKTEREFVKLHFPTNDSGQFSAQRLYTEGLFVSLIAVSTSDNVINVNTFKELMQLDEMVQNLTIQLSRPGAVLSFQQLCAQDQDMKCIPPNPLLSAVKDNVSLIETIRITYPVLQGTIFLGQYLGGVTLDSDKIVQKAQAVKLVYYLREDNKKDQEDSVQWINLFIKSITENLDKLQLRSIQVSYFSSISRQQEFEGITSSVIPLFSITYFLTIFFSIVSCIRLDCVRNKSWVAVFGVLSSGLAVLSSFGLLLICGVPFVVTVANAPFLILGVGVDDMFIMISSWQQTKVKDKVEERMAETYAEAAVSITITTLTDVLAFYIGILTSFQSVQSFCIYTGTAILFCFLYNITFFGAFLALNGRREESNRHWLICKKVSETSDEHSSSAYNMCCVGGGYSQITGKETDHPMTSFFHKQYGPFLTNIWTKILVGFLYAGYLASSIYGCFQVQEGIDLRNLAIDSSYVRSFYDDDDLYFAEYGPRVMVVVTEEVSYWDSDVQSKIDRCLESFINNSYVSESFSESWFSAYRVMASQMNLNISDKSNFIGHLSILFRGFPDFKQDVDIQSGAIIASRFFIQTVNVTSAVDERDMLNQVRDTAKSCEIPLLVYHPAFIYFDQYAVIIENTIQNVAVAAGAMLLISLLLIPNPLCSLWVTFTIASIIAGVTGFMAFWDVNLDSISMINLVICIGFSVDFSAHITYAYVSNHKSKVNDRMIDALHSLGYPIVQGAVSTILGVIVLAAAESYIFRTFFKIMFLVIAFGMLHGLVFLPVFLTFFGNCGRNEEDTKKIKPHIDIFPVVREYSIKNHGFADESREMDLKRHKTTSSYSNDSIYSDPDCL